MTSVLSDIKKRAVLASQMHKPNYNKDALRAIAKRLPEYSGVCLLVNVTDEGRLNTIVADPVAPSLCREPSVFDVIAHYLAEEYPTEAGEHCESVGDLMKALGFVDEEGNLDSRRASWAAILIGLEAKADPEQAHITRVSGPDLAERVFILANRIA